MRSSLWSLNPLWINTALKLVFAETHRLPSLNPLWINTALKRNRIMQGWDDSLNPLWINTALKPQIREYDLQIVVFSIRDSIIINYISHKS